MPPAPYQKAHEAQRGDEHGVVPEHPDDIPVQQIEQRAGTPAPRTVQMRQFVKRTLRKISVIGGITGQQQPDDDRRHKNPHRTPDDRFEVRVFFDRHLLSLKHR